MENLNVKNEEKVNIILKSHLPEITTVDILNTFLTPYPLSYLSLVKCDNILHVLGDPIYI